ncbi:MAG TPA: PH domain-containing protein [Acidimicrobiales bacterium]|nr:PH domain-containing protein [Acidimicrobiales bacterium]
MPFPRKLLNEGEDVVLDLHPHWWYFARPVTAVVVAAVAAVFAYTKDVTFFRIATLVLLVAAVGWLAVAYAKWSTTNVVVTTDRLIHRSGVLGKQGKEIPLERVNDISVHQTFFSRMIGAGDVTIESGGERGQQRFSQIARPFVVQNVIYVEMERAKARDADRTGGGGRRELSIPEQLEKLDDLRQRGIISQAEFDAKKTQLLERM